jgi:hypothetical protein
MWQRQVQYTKRGLLCHITDTYGPITLSTLVHNTICLESVLSCALPACRHMRAGCGALAELASNAAGCAAPATNPRLKPAALLRGTLTRTLIERCHAQVTDMTTAQAAALRAFEQQTCGGQLLEGKARAGAAGTVERRRLASYFDCGTTSTDDQAMRCRMSTQAKKLCQ